MSANSLIIATSALVGFSLSPEKQLATLPLALMFLSGTAITMPASLLMKYIGRRSGFIIGLLIGIIGAAFSAFAIVSGSFTGFCLGACLIGICNGFGAYYRFAAADVSTEAFRSRAISLVLAGGVVAAFVGPNLANLTKNWIGSALFAGGYVSIAILYAIAIGVLTFSRLPRPAQGEAHGVSRPLSEIIQQPVFIVAVLGGMISYGTMNVVMTATPLAMQAHGHLFSDTALVIQWHLLGMFVPSFFTGHLIKKFGIPPVMIAGAISLLLCTVVNLSGTDVVFFWIALVLLGVGWNFLFIGSTTLLTHTYALPEKAKTQGINDFIVFGTVSITALTSGWLHHWFGWQMINWGAIPVVLIAFSAAVWLRLNPAKKAFA